MAFLLPTLERILQEEGEGIRILIISPTRELATQIHTTAEMLVREHRSKRDKDKRNNRRGRGRSRSEDDGSISCQVLYGGVSKGGDLMKLDRQLPTILTATPGRLQDHLENSFLGWRQQNVADLMSDIDVLVLDEMDRLLDMGFRDDIRRIMSYLPHKKNRQTLLFSATVPPTVQEQIRACLKPDYHTVDCIQEDDPNTHVVNTVQQSHIVLPQDKMVVGVVKLIEELIKQQEEENKSPKIIVFFNTTSQTAFFAKLFRQSRNERIYIMELHSKLTQARRGITSDDFRKAKSAILFTSDVSARGVDYPDVSHVIQVGSASDRETYIHRLGRTGRAGKSGKGVLVLSPEEAKPVLREDLKGIKIPQGQELQESINSVLTGTSTSDDYPSWLANALKKDSVTKEAIGVYKSLIGYYYGRFKTLGIRRPGDRVVKFLNDFADEVGLEERPSLPYKVLVQYGLTDHPDVTVSRRSNNRDGDNYGYGDRGDRGGRGGGYNRRDYGGGGGGRGRGRGYDQQPDLRRGRGYIQQSDLRRGRKSRDDGGWY